MTIDKDTNCTLGKAVAESIHATTPGGYVRRLEMPPWLEAVVWVCTSGAALGLLLIVGK